MGRCLGCVQLRCFSLKAPSGNSTSCSGSTSMPLKRLRNPRGGSLPSFIGYSLHMSTLVGFCSGTASPRFTQGGSQQINNNFASPSFSFSQRQSQSSLSLSQQHHTPARTLSSSPFVTLSQANLGFSQLLTPAATNHTGRAARMQRKAEVAAFVSIELSEGSSMT
jgi:hypothetical protein